jgi:integrase
VARHGLVQDVPLAVRVGSALGISSTIATVSLHPVNPELMAALTRSDRPSAMAASYVEVRAVTSCLRHTTASLAISANANVKFVQRMLDHATTALTLDLYAHVLDDDLSGVAERSASPRKPERLSAD